MFLLSCEKDKTQILALIRKNTFFPDKLQQNKIFALFP